MPTRKDRLIEFAREFEVEGILAGCEKLMIVHLALSPVLGLVVQYITAGIVWRVAGTPQDTVGMWVARRLKCIELRVVAIQGCGIVVPVHRHRQRVRHECADHGIVGVWFPHRNKWLIASGIACLNRKNPARACG